MKARGALPNTKVSITRRVNGKFHPVVLTSNGKIKPDVVLKGGTEVNMPGGNFYLNWYPKGQANAVRQSVGADPTAALNAKRKIENELHILALGGKPAEPVTEPESRSSTSTPITATASTWTTSWSSLRRRRSRASTGTKCWASRFG